MSFSAAANARDFETREPTSLHFRRDSNLKLYSELVDCTVREASKYSPVPNVLDLGAGDGQAALAFLRLGCTVTAVDISEHQLERLRHDCAAFAPQLAVHVCNLETDARNIPGSFDIISASSMLHHIPDYGQLIRDVIQLLKPHGQFFSFQDPLRYDSLPITDRLFSEVSYAACRIRQPDALGGIARKMRRMRGVYLADCVADNSEYHVVRNGVDAEAIRAIFESNGFLCRIVPYFSTPSDFMQPIGERLNIKNTFAVVAQKHC